MENYSIFKSQLALIVMSFLLVNCSSPYFVQNNYKYSGLNSKQKYQVSASTGIDTRGINTFNISTALRLDSTFTLGSNFLYASIRENDFHVDNNTPTIDKTNARYIDIDLGFQPNFNEPSLIFETHGGIGFSGINNRNCTNDELTKLSDLNYIKYFVEFDLGYRSPSNNFETFIPLQFALARYSKINTFNDDSLDWLKSSKLLRVSDFGWVVRFGNENYKVNITNGFTTRNYDNNEATRGSFNISAGITFYDFLKKKQQNK